MKIFRQEHLAILPCIIMLSVLGTSACSDKKSGQSQKETVPVTVSAAVQKSIPVQLNAIGNIEAYSTVSIKARVGGELTHVYFKEGQYVNKGNLLFQIDPRPYKAALESAQANLMRDIALYKKAEEDVRRYNELIQEKLVSQSQYEQILSSAEALKATVEADKSAVEIARLQVEYCSIYAPLAGRTGNLLIDKGNSVKANDDKPMVLINQLQPIYVNFSVPEQYLSEIKMRMKSGSLPVEAFVSKGYINPFHGVLTFIDNTVDTATGTIKLKATFDNLEQALWPGQFVTVQITLSTIKDAIIAPSHAVQTGQQGQFVFVIKGDIAELRQIITGITHKDTTVIEKGLSPGEQVVTDGQMRLVPGAKVDIRTPGQQTNIKP